MAVRDALRRALRGDGGELGNERQRFIREAADFDQARVGRYRLYENYYDGEQHTRLLDRAKLYLETSGVRFAENVTELVIDTLADRLHIQAFKVENDEDLADWFSQTVWAANRMGEKQGVIHTEVPKLGDGFVIVDYDEQKELPRIRWNHPRLIKPVYDDADPDTMLYAVKKWTTTQRSAVNPTGQCVIRLNIYLPDRIEKWYSIDKDGENWVPWVEADGEPWPAPWTVSGELPADGEAEDPIGIPVVHFRNKPKGRIFGRSDVRGVIPYQAEINKQVLDLFYVMDAQGWQWPWVSGVSDTAQLKLAIGDVIKLTDPAARAGILPAADPKSALEAIQATYQRLAAKSQTPVHDLDRGEPPSGESRKTAESGLVKKAEDRQASFGNSHADVMSLAWRIMDVYGPENVVAPFDPKVEIETVWDDAEARNEAAETNMLAVQVELLGRSKTSALRALGLNPDEEAKLRTDEQAETPPEPAPPEPLDKPVVTEPATPAAAKIPKPA